MKNSMVAFVFLLTACGSVEYGDTLHGSAPPLPTAIGSQPQQAGLSITIEIFYEQLTPYGQWVDAPQLGRAFVPHDPDYRPYRNGHWARSGADMVWVSYDAIGWAVCHYGSWAVLDDGRWAWIPDTEWAPAWVEWREGEGYVGWAPRMAYTAPDISAQVAWVFIETAYLLTGYVAQYFVGDTHLDHVYESSPPMAHAPDRGWLDDRHVRPARAVSARARAGRGPPARGRRARARGTRVRDGVSSATARSSTVRGRTSDGLTERPGRVPERARPRETVVLGAGRVRRPRPSVSVDVTPAPSRPSGPPLALQTPTPTPNVYPAARAPRIVTPVPAAPRRIVTALRTVPSVTRAPRPTPRPMFIQRRAPRHVAPHVSRSQARPRFGRSQARFSRPQMHTSRPARATSRPSVARSRPQRSAPSRSTSSRSTSSRSTRSHSTPSHSTRSHSTVRRATPSVGAVRGMSTTRR